MFRISLAVAVLSIVPAAPASAADIYAEVSGVAHFRNAAGTLTEILTSGTALPNGGRQFDFGEFGYGGALCPAFTGQNDFLCASASARIDITRTPIQTSTFAGIATSVTMKAAARFTYRNGPPVIAGQLWGRARLHIPVICSGAVAPPVSALAIRYRLNGEHDIFSSDPALIIDAPRPFAACEPGSQCTIAYPNFTCGESGTTTLSIDLYPRIQFSNPEFHSGWTIEGVADYSHTFTIEGIDILDENGDPIPGVRAIVPGVAGANDTFLTAAEFEEAIQPSTTSTTVTTATTTTSSVAGTITTTTSVPGTVSTTTSLAGTVTTTTSLAGATTTTSSTIPAPCAGTAGLATAVCRCEDTPPVACDGLTLARPIAKALTRLCTTVGKAATLTGKKRVRLSRRAATLARRALAKVNGRKGDDVPSTCRDGLRAFIGAVQADIASAPS